MTQQQGLFDFDSCPRPLYKPLDTRAKAREKVKPSKKQLHVRLIKAFYSGEWNADAWAMENGLSILSVRPRVTELKKAGLLHRVGYGLTQDGNEQDKFTLYPLYRDRMAVLIEKFGMDKAAEQVLGAFLK